MDLALLRLGPLWRSEVLTLIAARSIKKHRRPKTGIQERKEALHFEERDPRSGILSLRQNFVSEDDGAKASLAGTAPVLYF